MFRRARAEIDEVCDEETMPTFADWDRMRYIRMGMSLRWHLSASIPIVLAVLIGLLLYAVTKESLRWRPPFPWGVQHSLEQGLCAPKMAHALALTAHCLVDDTCNGYHLPKDSLCMLSVVCIGLSSELNIAFLTVILNIWQVLP